MVTNFTRGGVILIGLDLGGQVRAVYVWVYSLVQTQKQTPPRYRATRVHSEYFKYSTKCEFAPLAPVPKELPQGLENSLLKVRNLARRLFDVQTI